MIFCALHIMHRAVWIWSLLVSDVKSDDEMKILRDGILFDAHPSSYNFLKFIEDQYYERNMILTKYLCEKNKRHYHIYDTDLENIFGSKSLAEMFWKVFDNNCCGKYLNCEKHHLTNEKAFKSQIRLILSNVCSEKTTCMEKLKLILLLTYRRTFKNRTEFVLNYLTNKNDPEIRSKCKVLEYIVTKMYAEVLELEKSKQEYKQYLRQMELIIQRKEYLPRTGGNVDNIKNVIFAEFNRVKSRLLMIYMKRKTLITLELNFVVDLLLYISGNQTQFSCFSMPDRKKRISELVLICKLIAILPIEKLKEPINSNIRDSLSGLLQIVLSSFEFNEFKSIQKRNKCASICSRVVKLLKKGIGLYCKGNTELWIHIGSKNLEQLKEFERQNGDVFWKALANLSYGIHSIPTIHITISHEREEEQFDISPAGTINFSKYVDWTIWNSNDGVLNYANNGCLIFKYLANNNFAFKFVKKLSYSSCFSRIIVSCVKEKNYSQERIKLGGLLLPLADYSGTYRFCNKSLHDVVYRLRKILSLQVNEIIINLTGKCKHMENSESTGISTADQITSEFFENLAFKLQHNNNLETIIIHANRPLNLIQLFESEKYSELGTFKIVCSCNERDKCSNKAQCELWSKHNKRIYFTHLT